jgi:hypothetical protein
MNNHTVKITCYVGDDANKQPFEEEIACDVNIADFREAAKVKLGLSNSQAYGLLLEQDNRQLKILDESKTFESENIRQGDKLVFIPIDTPLENSGVHEDTPSSTNSLSLVTYTLSLTVVNNGKYISTHDYPIVLKELYEDNPAQFFSNNRCERQKLEAVLRYKVAKVLEKNQIDRIIKEWCEDISLGYRTAFVKI